MGQSLTEIAQTLRDADKKVQLIYALMALKLVCLVNLNSDIPKNMYQNRKENQILNTIIMLYGRLILLGQRFRGDSTEIKDTTSSLRIKATNKVR